MKVELSIVESGFGVCVCVSYSFDRFVCVVFEFVDTSTELYCKSSSDGNRPVFLQHLNASSVGPCPETDEKRHLHFEGHAEARRPKHRDQVCEVDPLVLKASRRSS